MWIETRGVRLHHDPDRLRNKDKLLANTRLRCGLIRSIRAAETGRDREEEPKFACGTRDDNR
jgi:hypothetical protein